MRASDRRRHSRVNRGLRSSTATDDSPRHDPQQPGPVSGFKLVNSPPSITSSSRQEHASLGVEVADPPSKNNSMSGLLCVKRCNCLASATRLRSRIFSSTAYIALICSNASAAPVGSAVNASKNARRACAQHRAWLIPEDPSARDQDQVERKDCLSAGPGRGKNAACLPLTLLLAPGWLHS